MKNYSILTVPGLGSSGPAHWQTYWEQHYGYQRVEQRDWDTPLCTEWVQALAAKVDAAGPDVILVGHSLACATIVHWATSKPSCVKGALLVAPADVDRPSFPTEAVGFGPMPLLRLPFPSVVLASANDEFVILARAKQFAQAWGSRFINVGALGHINSASGLGRWPQGHIFLEELLNLL